MKVNPKTKHSKKFLAEKTALLSKAALAKRLDIIKKSICEYLKEHPVNITCGDIKDEYKYTVFISISDGKSRARVCHASAPDFENAWKKVCEKAGMVTDKYKLTPIWIKADVVDFVERIFSSNLREKFLEARYQNFFRMGFSLDPRMDMAFLEAEANSCRLFDYTVLPMKASLPGHENVPCIDVERVSNYMEWNGRKSIPFVLPYSYLFSCKSFFMDSDNQVYKLYDEGIHCGRRETAKELSPELVKVILTSSSQYLNRQILKNGKFIYGYFPPYHATMTSYNILRHTGTLWSMMCAYEVTEDDSLIETVNKAIGYLLTQIIYMDDETAFVVEKKSNEIKLGGNGVAIIALSKHMEVFGNQNFTEIIRKLANGILYMQNKETGKMTHVLNSDDYTVKEETRTVYYDGESSYALIKAYDISNDGKYLDAARLSIDYFIEKDYVIYRDHWLAYAMNEFTKYVQEEKYFTFALRNAWENRTKIKNQPTSYHTYLELLMETYDMYLRMKQNNISVEYLQQIDEEELVDVIKYRVWHMLDGYFYPEYAMYMERPDKIFGAFFIRHDNFRTRIDDEQHFIDGYVKYYKLILENEIG